MKGLSLTQPWATLVALGAKQYETRSWSTVYRGLVAIHASKGFPRECRALLDEEPFYGYLPLCARPLPLGHVVAVAYLADCITTAWAKQIHESEERRRHELAFGDYTAGRYAFKLMNARALKHPVPAKGALGFWPIDDALRCEIEAQLTPVAP